MIHLDNRLQAVADFVKAGRPVADIGTDHGYLALALIQSGKTPHAIAVDKNEGPYQAACRTIQNAGMERHIEVRLGDGLHPLQPGEATVLCMAGMGGQLMKEILLAEPKVSAQAEQLVLQPMNGARELRQWLYGAGWHLADEALAEADGRIYEILSAEKGSHPMPKDILLDIGPCLWEKKPSLLQRHIEERLSLLRRAMEGMEESAEARSSQKYLEFKKRAIELEEYLYGKMSDDT